MDQRRAAIENLERCECKLAVLEYEEATEAVNTANVGIKACEAALSLAKNAIAPLGKQVHQLCLRV
jgi:hypothetical protein